MKAEQQVEQALELLEQQTAATQALLRPLVLRVMSDPDTLKVLGSHALIDHLPFVATVLNSWGAMPRDSRRRLPPREDIFLNFTIGRPFEDVEDAYSFVRNLEGPGRDAVDEALRVALDIPLRQKDRLSLLAVARLLRLALTNPTSVEHLVQGGPVEAFLDEAPTDAETRRRTHSTPRKRKSKK